METMITFTVRGSFYIEDPKSMTPILDLNGEVCGFTLAGGDTIHPQLVLERMTADESKSVDLGSDDEMASAGFTCLDYEQKTFEIEDEAFGGGI